MDIDARININTSPVARAKMPNAEGIPMTIGNLGIFRPLLYVIIMRTSDQNC